MFKKSHTAILVLIFLVEGLVGALLIFARYPSTMDPHIVESLTKLGDAFIIAVILGVTVDWISKSRMQEEISEYSQRIGEDVFRAILKKQIPEAIFGEVKRCVFDAPVIRKGHKVTYTLEEIEKQPTNVACKKYIKCSAQSTYTLTNVNDTNYTHKVTMALEKPIDTELHQFVKIESVKIGDRTLSSNEIADYTTVEPQQIVFSCNVDLKSNESISVNIDAQLIKASTDQEVWSSKIPSDGIEIAVYHPREFEVLSKANHSQPIDTTGSNNTVQIGAIRHGVFPHQSVAFWWHPKNGIACPNATIT